jgi:hypothetical protein
LAEIKQTLSLICKALGITEKSAKVPDIKDLASKLIKQKKRV